MIPLVSPDVEAYAEAHTTPDPAHLVALAAETRAVSRSAQMMVGPIEGRLLAMLVAATRPALVLEVGTFTGYSALSMAAALPPGGRIVTCEISERHAEIARRHIASSPYADVIEVRLGPAAQTIATLDGPFDFVFIDADKGGYLDYYEAALAKLAPHGLMAVDNVLWSGAVVDPGEDPSADTVALMAFNDHVINDSRVECVMATVRDGLLLVRRG